MNRTKDLDEILQIHSVFLNVSKGQVAKEAELVAAFGTNDVNQIILEILQKGQVQVGSEERGEHLKMFTREIASIVADKCVNPRSRTPYPVGIIEQAMTELHFSPNLTKTAKQQALEVIKQLEQGGILPIARAQMRLQLELPTSEADGMIKTIKPMLVSVEGESRDETITRLTCLINPGQYRALLEASSKAPWLGKLMIKVISLRDFVDSSPAPSQTPP